MKIYLIFLLFPILVSAQDPKVLSFRDFMEIVMKGHPAIKSAELEINMADARVNAARGAFDPRLEAEVSEKVFNGVEYYNLRNGLIKIPTWFGIEFNAGYENNDGNYLNPQNFTPEPGLLGVGVKIPIGQNLIINRRMADLQNAKRMLSMSRSELILAKNNILFDAAIAYVEWQNSNTEYMLYKRYSTIADQRYKGVASMVTVGEKAAIDSIEASIIRSNRLLNLEQADLKLINAKLALSNYLWGNSNIPFEVTELAIPEDVSVDIFANVIEANILPDAIQVEDHPKIRILREKLKIMETDRKLAVNELLPKLDFSYSYLSGDRSFSADYLDNQKFGIEFSYPLFLRKERGNLKVAKLRFREGEIYMDLQKQDLKTKISSNITEVNSLKKQLKLVENMRKQNDAMLKAEEQIFSMGESSLFLLNSRETNLISAELEALYTNIKLKKAQFGLYKESGKLALLGI